MSYIIIYKWHLDSLSTDPQISLIDFTEITCKSINHTGFEKVQMH